MLKSIAALEVKIGERLYRMLCDHDSPLGEVHDALTQMKTHVVDKIKDLHEQEKPKQEEVK